MSGIGYLERAAASDVAARSAEDDTARLGYVMNATQLWAHLPTAHRSLFEMMEVAVEAASLTFRQKAVLVTATASGLGDSYCSLAWGLRLADAAGIDVATKVARGRVDQLDAADRVLAEWAEKVVTDPTGTVASDVEPLRAAGFDDAQIFALTVYIALRVTFATVNNALGAEPDPELIARAPVSLIQSIPHIPPTTTTTKGIPQ